MPRQKAVGYIVVDCNGKPRVLSKWRPDLADWRQSYLREGVLFCGDATLFPSYNCARAAIRRTERFVVREKLDAWVQSGGYRIQRVFAEEPSPAKPAVKRRP